jgi:hypothetical protein
MTRFSVLQYAINLVMFKRATQEMTVNTLQNADKLVSIFSDRALSIRAGVLVSKLLALVLVLIIKPLSALGRSTF